MVGLVELWVRLQVKSECPHALFSGRTLSFANSTRSHERRAWGIIDPKSNLGARPTSGAALTSLSPHWSPHLCSTFFMATATDYTEWCLVFLIFFLNIGNNIRRFCVAPSGSHTSRLKRFPPTPPLVHCIGNLITSHYIPTVYNNNRKRS